VGEGCEGMMGCLSIILFKKIYNNELKALREELLCVHVNFVDLKFLTMPVSVEFVEGRSEVHLKE
jgi:hypothetical protein